MKSKFKFRVQFDITIYFNFRYTASNGTILSQQIQLLRRKYATDSLIFVYFYILFMEGMKTILASKEFNMMTLKHKYLSDKLANLNIVKSIHTCMNLIWKLFICSAITSIKIVMSFICCVDKYDAGTSDFDCQSHEYT